MGLRKRKDIIPPFVCIKYYTVEIWTVEEVYHLIFFFIPYRHVPLINLPDSYYRSTFFNARSYKVTKEKHSLTLALLHRTLEYMSKV